MKKKIILIVLYVAVHFLIMRDVRTTAFSLQINALAEGGIEQVDNTTISKLGTRLIYFEYESQDFEKIWTYKLPFGFFFFLGIIGLILIGANKNYYFILIGIHLLISLIGALIFTFLVYKSAWMLAVSDLLSRYLIPLSSIAIIPLSLIEKRQFSVHEEKT